MLRSMPVSLHPEIRLLDIIRGRIARDLLEHPAEVERVLESQPAADFRNIHVRVPEQPGGFVDPDLFVVLHDAHAGLLFENAADIIVIHADVIAYLTGAQPP